MPTFKAGYNTYIAFGTSGSEVDYSALMDSADVGDMIAKLETTSFGDTAKKYTPGLGETSCKISGRFSQTEWTALQALKGVAGKSLVLGPGGHGTGDMKYSNGSVFIANLSLKSAVAGIVTGDIEFCISGVWTLGTF